MCAWVLRILFFFCTRKFLHVPVLICLLFTATSTVFASGTTGNTNAIVEKGAGEGEGEGEGEGVGLPEYPRIHSADMNGNLSIELPELLRVIQFFNIGGLHCADSPQDTEDGYVPGPGLNQSCARHSSDYLDSAWNISLLELLRLIQFFNVGFYRAAPLAGTEDGFSPGRYPNVVILMLDTLRADRIHGTRNGVSIMPFLSQFASQGADFTQAYSSSAWTRPSIHAIFTGLRPEAYYGGPADPHSLWFNVPQADETITEWLTGLGYDAWAVFNNTNISAAYGFDQGFPVGQIQTELSAPAAIINNRVLDMVEQWREPFFSYIHYVDPHTLYTPPAAHVDVFGPLPSLNFGDSWYLNPANFYNYMQDVSVAWATNTAPTYVLTANGIEAMRHYYDGECHYLDSELQIIVSEILSRFPETIFIFVSDHGEDLHQRYIPTHGHSLFNDQLHVPFIMHGPGITPQTYPGPVETHGILPALAQLLNLPPRPQWQVLNPFTAPTDSPVFGVTRITIFGQAEVSAFSVYRNNYKLIRHSLLGGPSLYNLSTDPGETNDVSSANPALTAELEALLDNHLSQFGL